MDRMVTTVPTVLIILIPMGTVMDIQLRDIIKGVNAAMENVDQNRFQFLRVDVPTLEVIVGMAYLSMKVKVNTMVGRVRVIWGSFCSPFFYF